MHRGRLMRESERRSAIACLGAVEANLAELRDLPDWWSRIGEERRRSLLAFEAEARADQHELQNLPMTETLPLK